MGGPGWDRTSDLPLTKRKVNLRRILADTRDTRDYRRWRAPPKQPLNCAYLVARAGIEPATSRWVYSVCGLTQDLIPRTHLLQHGRGAGARSGRAAPQAGRPTPDCSTDHGGVGNLLGRD